MSIERKIVKVSTPGIRLVCWGVGHIARSIMMNNFSAFFKSDE